MHVTVKGKLGVLEGVSWTTRERVAKNLDTPYKIVGDRIEFEPCRHTLDYIAKDLGASFDSACRTVWAHFYKAKTPADYDFDFVLPPYKHQFRVWDQIKDREFFALEWEMGLGKTKTLLDVALWKREKNEIDAVLVITLPGVHRNWIEKETPKHWPLDDGTLQAFWNPNRVEKGMRDVIEHKGFVIATMNFEAVPTKLGFAWLKKFLKARKVMLVLDESHKIKTPGARRTKKLIEVSDLAVCRFTATGTPIPKDALDVWGPYRFLSKRLIWEHQFFSFRKKYAQLADMEISTGQIDDMTGEMKTRVVKMVVGTQREDELRDRISPHRSRLLKTDVLDLPEKIYRRRDFELTTEQKRAYNQMVEDLLIELDDFGIVTAPLAITKMIRLRQLVCGFVKPDDEEVRPFGKKNPRMTALIEELESCHGNAIIWSTFRYSNDMINEAVAKVYGPESIVRIDGTVHPDLRGPLADRFEDPTDPARFLNGSQAVLGTGYTLVSATDAIYYNNDFSLVERLQSEDRNHRIGQEHSCTYTDLVATGSCDDHLIDSLLVKQRNGAKITGDDLKEWLVKI